MPEQAGKVATTVVDSFKGTPMLLALLLVNAGFLGILVYLMAGAVANSNERNKMQLELIAKLITDIRDCGKQGPRPNNYDPTTKSFIFLR
jgi:uncharacterized membrane protein